MIRKIFWLLSTKYFFENLMITKLVEGNFITCMDEGSNPSDSTIKRNFVTFSIHKKRNKFYLIALCCLKRLDCKDRKLHLQDGIHGNNRRIIPPTPPNVLIIEGKITKSA